MKELTFTRHRRLRSSASMSNVKVRETYLQKEDLIYRYLSLMVKILKMQSAQCQECFSYLWTI